MYNNQYYLVIFEAYDVLLKKLLNSLSHGYVRYKSWVNISLFCTWSLEI